MNAPIHNMARPVSTLQANIIILPDRAEKTEQMLLLVKQCCLVEEQFKNTLQVIYESRYKTDY